MRQSRHTAATSFDTLADGRGLLILQIPWLTEKILVTCYCTSLVKTSLNSRFLPISFFYHSKNALDIHIRHNTEVVNTNIIIIIASMATPKEELYSAAFDRLNVFELSWC